MQSQQLKSPLKYARSPESRNPNPNQILPTASTDQKY